MVKVPTPEFREQAKTFLHSDEELSAVSFAMVDPPAFALFWSASTQALLLTEKRLVFVEAAKFGRPRLRKLAYAVDRSDVEISNVSSTFAFDLFTIECGDDVHSYRSPSAWRPETTKFLSALGGATA